MSLRPETTAKLSLSEMGALMDNASIGPEPTCSCGHPGLHPEWHMKGCAWLEWSKQPAPEGLPPDPLGPWTQSDPVHSPRHYTSHPSGVECIQIAEHMGFNLGNAIKYIWRADQKGKPIQDLEKAVFYIQREIERRKNVVD